jgi:rare lipoprotein A
MITAFNNRSLVFAFLSLFALAACAETEFLVHTAKTARGESKPAPVGDYKVGKPYQIKGQWYYPIENFEYVETGIASWYGPNFHGKPTANGEVFDQNLMTAAHRTLPLPSAVRVTNLENGRTIVLRVNDRGPFSRGRIIDVSRRGAQLLGFEKNGTAKVRVEIMPDDSRQLKLAAINRQGGGAEQPQVASSPRQDVVATPLPNSGPRPVQHASNIAPRQAVAVQARDLAAVPVLSEEVEVLPVSPTGIFVQTGAFSDFENALRMRNRVFDLGPTQISRFRVAGTELYRVRIGPLQTVAMADTTLTQLTNAGVPNAQLIVE